MIKTIIFDYGGVIGPDSDSWSFMYKDLVKSTKLPEETVDVTWNKHARKMLNGEEDLPDFFKELSELSKEEVKAEELQNSYFQNTIINKNVIEYIEELKKQGYRLLLLSNETKSGMKNKIEKFHLLELFDNIYCSANLGMTKRDSRIFFYVLKKEQIKSGETIFIDDREHNIATAKELGFKAIHFNHLSDLIQKIEMIIKEV